MARKGARGQTGDSGSRAVERVSDVVQLLSASPRRGQGVSEVANSLGISRQAASRLLDGLMKAGIALKDPATRRYRLSLLPYVWFRRIALDRGPTDAIRAEMISVANETNSVVTYGILDGSLAIALEQAEQIGPATIIRPGTVAGPWFETLSGKTLVAFSGPESAAEILRTRTELSRNERAALEEELEIIRSQGLAQSDDSNRYRVAVPLRDSDGMAFASLIVVSRDRDLGLKDKESIANVASSASIRCSSGMVEYLSI